MFAFELNLTDPAKTCPAITRLFELRFSWQGVYMTVLRPVAMMEFWLKVMLQAERLFESPKINRRVCFPPSLKIPLLLPMVREPLLTMARSPRTVGPAPAPHRRSQAAVIRTTHFPGASASRKAFANAQVEKVRGVYPSSIHACWSYVNGGNVRAGGFDEGALGIRRPSTVAPLVVMVVPACTSP